MSNQLTNSSTTKPTRTFELKIVLILAIAALSLVSLFSEAAGIIGSWLAKFIRFWFGQLSVLPPVFAVVFSIYALISRGRQVNRRKLMAGIIVCVLLFTITHLLFGRDITFNEILHFSSSEPGAGIIGATFSTLLLKAFGNTGCYVILAFLSVIALVLYIDMPFNKLIEATLSLLGSMIKGIGRASIDFFIGLLTEVRDLFGLAKDAWVLRKHQETAAGIHPQLAPRRRPQNKKVISKPAVSNCNEDTPATEVVESTNLNELLRGKIGESKKSDRSSKPTTATKNQTITTRTASTPGEAVNFHLPPTALLERVRDNKGRNGRVDQTELVESALNRFNIEAKVVNVDYGPVVTRYEVQPAPGVKVRQITSLTDDLALALAAASIRIEAPVPGKSVVGIEVANKETSMVTFREVVESPEFLKSESKLSIALGKDISGAPVVADLRRMLHVLVAGATGSGKSVCVNVIIASILFKAQPQEVKLLMIDPKRVELQVYDGIPHLVAPVVTDPKEAAQALRWAVKEMERRYNLFSLLGVRNIDSFNRKVALGTPYQDGNEESTQPLPFIVVIIDELADLMMVAQHDVEDSICRLAQMARAAGIHLIIATQRPSVDVITGLIKANVPSRIAFAVSSNHDSRTILDMVGAERLLGKGDMLFYPFGANKPQRVQGALILDKEVGDLVKFWKSQGDPEYTEKILTVEEEQNDESTQVDDELYEDAVRLVIQNDSASISMLQRRFRIGYSRAARLIDMMEINGVVGPYQGSKPREVLLNRSPEFDDES